MQPPRVRCERIHPTLRVRDVRAAVRFYTERLGFALAFELPRFAGVELGGAQVFLEEREGAGGGGAYFVIDDVDALFALHRAQGVAEGAGLVDQEYGLRDYAIRDMDGNGLAFGQRIARTHEAQD